MSIRIRPATEQDIGHLGRYQMASYGGFAEVMYEDAVPGLSPRQIVEMRLEQEGTTFHYSHGWVAEFDGNVAGGVHAYPVDDEDDDPPDPFIPSDRLYYFAPLEGLVLPGSFYLNLISVDEAFRGQGIGKALMTCAIDAGREKGFERMSLLALQGNTAALKLYDSLGFRELKRRPIVDHPALRFKGALLLMAKDI